VITVKVVVLDSPNITTFDVKQVLNYLIEQQKKRVPKSAVSLEKRWLGQFGDPTFLVRKF
jgi:hypothetical protein